MSSAREKFLPAGALGLALLLAAGSVAAVNIKRVPDDDTRQRTDYVSRPEAATDGRTGVWWHGGFCWRNPGAAAGREWVSEAGVAQNGTRTPGYS